MKESTIRTWINNGELRAFKFGREWRVSAQDLEKFVLAHASRGPEGGEDSDYSMFQG